MRDISTDILLAYVFRYALTFVICLLGSFIKDAYDTITRSTKINIIRILISAMFVSFIMCALDEAIEMPFGVYVFITLFSGIWGFAILQSSFNIKIVGQTIKLILSLCIGGNGAQLSKTIDTIEKEINDEDKKDNKEE